MYGNYEVSSLFVPWSLELLAWGVHQTTHIEGIKQYTCMMVLSRVISHNSALLGLVIYWPWLDVDGFNPPLFSCLQFFAAMIVVINLSMTLFGATRNIFVKEFLESAGIILFVLRNVWAIPWPRARSCRSCRCVSSYNLETRDALRIFFFFDSARCFCWKDRSAP